jgi:hypothetical protein
VCARAHVNVCTCTCTCVCVCAYNYVGGVSYTDTYHTYILSPHTYHVHDTCMYVAVHL